MVSSSSVNERCSTALTSPCSLRCRPPPILNINSSDSLTIHVKNQLNDGMGTALHSHGMFFNGTGYYDGAVGITQCPIPPNER